MARYPTWVDTMGTRIDDTTASTLLEAKLREYEAWVIDCEAYATRMESDAVAARETADDERARLDYWKSVLAVTKEVDRRLAAGETVVLDGES
jgi:hypothetical protein